MAEKKIPKSEQKITEWVNKISKPYDKKNNSEKRIIELEEDCVHFDDYHNLLNCITVYLYYDEKELPKLMENTQLVLETGLQLMNDIVYDKYYSYDKFYKLIKLYKKYIKIMPRYIELYKEYNQPEITNPPIFGFDRYQPRSGPRGERFFGGKTKNRKHRKNKTKRKTTI